MGEETSHLKHIITGIALAATGLGILIYNNKALDRKIKFIIRK